ncbi:MAG: CoA transferase [Proteobacteria bacterium]|nr:CoA transferase [Pseudomonadota bacterium]MBI3496772.1 CoA transferase [Pseudomonadota bacterium]
MAGDLEGILVVSLEQAVAAPFCSSRLADAGARVIKIERPEGDFARRYDGMVNGQSTYFVWLNRGKESLTLDIKAPADSALLQRILAKADVFIQNLAPGAAERAGIGSAALTERHPKLIAVDISGYGDAGPYREMKAYDLLVQAESGLCSVNGGPEAPARVGVSVCDIAAGMYAHAAVLQALYARERTGKGRVIKVSLFSGMADWMTVPWLQYTHTGEVPKRSGLDHPTIAPYGPHRCADGAVLISIQNEREWPNLCTGVLDDPGLAVEVRFKDNESRVKHRRELTRRIESMLTTLPRREVERRLKAAKIAFGGLNTVADFARHPQLKTVPVETPEGVIDLVAPPAEIVGETQHFRPIPRVGEHDQQIRREFG